MPTYKDKSVVLLHGFFALDALKGLKSVKKDSVFVLEGRPNFSSAKIVVDLLQKQKIKPTIIADNMAGFLFFNDFVKEVWISYQDQSEEGLLSPAGSLILSVLAKRHKIPVRALPASKRIKALGKERDVFYFNRFKVAPKNIHGYVPLLEWVPYKYISEKEIL